MSADEQAIRDLVALWHSATAKGDVDTVLGLMAEDVVFLAAGRPPLRGRGWHSSRGFARSSRRVGSSRWATSRRSKSPEALPGAGPVSRSGSSLSRAAARRLERAARCRFFHKLSDGSWVVVRDANLLPPGP